MPWIALLVLAAGAAPDAEPAGWYDNYKLARPAAIEQNLPMLLVIDHPDTPHHHVSKNEPRVQEAKLLQKYLRCRVDASTEYGAKVAAAFKVSEYPHTVIIDRTGRYQVFIHRGTMTEGQWIAALTGYQPRPRPPQRQCLP